MWFNLIYLRDLQVAAVEVGKMAIRVELTAEAITDQVSLMLCIKSWIS